MENIFLMKFKQFACSGYALTGALL